MSKNLKTLVIGTTLTAESDWIVRTGAAIARATGAVPWLVYAYNLQAFPSELGAFDNAWIEEQAEILRERLDRQARETGLAELPGFGPDQACLSLDTPHHAIVDLAQKVDADLIVVGASEGNALQRAFLGSTADRVVRKAPCPVFVVRSGATFPPTRALVPVDLSPVSAGALRFATAFLRETGGKLTDIETLFVLNPLEVEGSLQFTPGQVERFAGEELDRFTKLNAPADHTSHQVLIGYPREEILREIEDRRADIVVLGTHGRSGFERMMIGSIAAEVLQRARCNVAVVPPTLTTEGAEREKTADWNFVSDETPATAAL
ncbi:MAG TPA: universal stress protein [Thermoanaerobaculia bacterium]